MFRRSQSVPSDTARPAEPAKPHGKGRPTPKRREAEKRRRQPITAPRDRKEALRAARDRQRADRERARQGMARGDDRYLPARDRGPARQFARDWVDSRRTIGSYLMWAMLVVLALTFVPLVVARLLVTPLMLLLMVTVLLESLLIARRVTRAAAERFPEENRGRVGLYAAIRAMQMRRARMPQPRVNLGDKGKV